SKSGNNLQPYLFFIGDRRPHKNLKKMIDIFLLLQQNFGYEGTFIIAGSKVNFDIDLDNYVADKKNINIIGPVSDEELSCYYQNMNALFFLSKYEGFGLPILEAARFNKKIITSNTSSLPEVTPCTGLMLSPDGNNEELARSIASYLSSTIEIENETFLTNFSWPKTAHEIFFDIRNI
ncbi:MAG: glycosyltransferase, partial [Alteromonadaceae bacterium]